MMVSFGFPDVCTPIKHLQITAFVYDDNVRITNIDGP